MQEIDFEYLRRDIVTVLNGAIYTGKRVQGLVSRAFYSGAV